MAANLKRYLMILCLSPLLAWADSSIVIEAAKLRLQTATTRYEQKIKLCTQQEKAHVLPSTVFSGMSLTKEEVRVALAYFFARNDKRCYEPEATELFRASLLARTVKLPGYAPEEDLEAGRLLLVLTSYGYELKREVEYVQLPLEKRQKLETISELQQVFDLVPSLDALEPVWSLTTP
ncbi:hypothetical protein HA052_23510 [Chromobacterium haemolyticum]|uniref:Uncharacterized protein n=1 Tax=Chromobacterium fluminis TaxID=3044269 RepID=A0ABX0LGV5_9NEIS|nr:hypothetical protein [Chromobacterium haemolyticum]NHR08163.1 hypothetical protein [Chromobacterium haemolyticum]